MALSAMGLAGALSLTGSAQADCQISYTDIRGVVTVNGIPTPGVQIEELCCDTGNLLNCTNADPHSTSASLDLTGESCTQSGAITNYVLSFNNTANGGFCQGGCSTVPGISYGGFCPWSVELRFTYQGCVVIVPCDVVSNAYFFCPQAVLNVNMTCNTNPPPPCTNCVDPVFGLGSAAGISVLELGASKVSITGPAGGILGNIDIAPKGQLSLTGSEYVAGTINLGVGATFANSSSGSIGGIQQNVDLSGPINAAYAANANDANLPCTQSFTTLDGKSVKTITGTSGLNVICVKDISLSGTQISLTGPADAKFIFNITGKLVLTGGGAGPQIRVDASKGIPTSAVLFNLIGTGQDVAFSGGGGGTSCCAAIVDGTILAPYRKIALAPGLVNGEVISGLDISIVSGSSVRCPPCP